MTEVQTISGPTLGPEDGTAPTELVILLHGVGSDGNDLIGLAPYFQKVLPGALFVSPHAPFAFDMAPFGHQWFSLQDPGPEARVEGTRTAAPILDNFIDQQIEAAGLGPEKTALIGFSQGTMMALYCGLRREKRLAGILAYSGMLIGEQTLADEIKSRPPVLLVHGELDDVVPVDAIDVARASLEGAGVRVLHHRQPGLAHGIDETCIRLGMGFLAEIFGVDLEKLMAEASDEAEDGANPDDPPAD